MSEENKLRPVKVTVALGQGTLTCRVPEAVADEIERLREWRKVAMMLGETFASVGPDAYYQMQPREWLAWAMNVTGATVQQGVAP